MSHDRLTIFLLVWVLGAPAIHAQAGKAGQLIVQFANGFDHQQLHYDKSRKAMPYSTKALSARKNIHHLHFDTDADLGEMKAALEQHPAVLHVQYNRELKRRGGGRTPNDPLYAQQWNLERIGLPDVWMQGTGGTTPCGDPIVLAVFDFGIDADHPDIADQLWTNPGEIPDNGFDDDQNGYVDDYLGVNLDTKDDKHAIDPQYHGTSVAGVMGSKGDNGLGVSGISWQNQLLIISSEEKDEALAIQAMEYVIQLRQKYNDTNGAEGAYIVAMNNSWGREGLFEEQFPIFCGMFNDLGAVGVLGVGSTENDQVNTDVFGDIPSDCSSDFLIVVTNTDQSDELAVAGFGKENVDLSAPGEGIYTLAPDGQYTTEGGTSYATPHVSGAIGLLYSLPTAPFCDHARISPTDALRDIKRFILDGAKPLPSLQGKTVSGGRLDLVNTIDRVTHTLDLGAVALQVRPNPVGETLYVDLSTKHSTSLEVNIYDVLGRLIYAQRDLDSSDPWLKIDASQWPAGYYVLNFRSAGSQGSLKLLKQ